MSSHYNLRSQRSAVPSVEPCIPGTLAESPLTDTETYNTPTPSPTESPPVLVLVSPFSDPCAPIATWYERAEPYERVPSEEPENNKINENPFLSTSESSSDDENSPWTTADHHRCKSKRELPVRKDLVVEAEKLLTEEEKKHILNRRHVEEEALSQGLTPSTMDKGQSKGKNIDPRNWGDAGLEESNLDEGPEGGSEATSNDESDTVTRDPIQEAVEAAVRQATQKYEEQIRQLQNKLENKRTSKGKHKKAPKAKASKEKVTFDPIQEMVDKAIKHTSRAREWHATPPAVNAAAQIAKKSYLGHAFKDVRRPKKRNSDESTSASSSATEQSSMEDSSSSSEMDGSSPVKDRRASRLAHRAKKRKLARQKKILIKPVPPTEYDRSPDSHTFHRFMTEGKAYLEDGAKPMISTLVKCQIGLESGGSVDSSPSCLTIASRWTIGPSNEKNCTTVIKEIDKWVRDYISDLNELWMMIGNVPNREKVMKFWFGLNPTIQKELYKMHLNPEISALSKVQHTAEIIELAHSVATETRGRDETHKSDKKSGARTDKANSSSRKNDGPSSESRDSGGHTKANGLHRGSRRGHTGQGGKPPKDRTQDDKRSSDTRGPKLSKEEHDKLMSEGQCFICKETGHMSRQCPKRTTVPSSPGSSRRLSLADRW
ncbi:hypothetical protein CY34DRAFT_13650 [Suillus luteus UH-Slu-Lm8-n1]|uniref:Unplaced genomic scaffold CY34scaffold_168, whole genome shotgun sequence n=1 Tax=Suillus luteus UH-Slu-Lm8-n1 TaxID=930992 RepID=A0A0D0BAB5_9AGAM|nr:hypothetical protein CY34DRAFT_13650 [Suillus luteus UH-Slu-Lm8-n1]